MCETEGASSQISLLNSHFSLIGRFYVSLEWPLQAQIDVAFWLTQLKGSKMCLGQGYLKRYDEFSGKVTWIGVAYLL